ncbi:MAG: FecR domain-containing protein [Planctomycetes bacterium]|nr:FecR domain-containing protein [Planctomycetota bacterium]
MDCREIQANVPAYQSGELPEDLAAAVGRHLAQCPACMTDARKAQTTLALLKTIDDITPSEAVWQNLKREITRAASTPGTGSLRALLRFAAAASILVAAFSFLFVAMLMRPTHAATIAFVAPDAPAPSPGTRLTTGQTFHAPTYVVLTLPDIGLLKLQRDTEIRFVQPTRLHIVRGEIFAEVTRGFVVESPDATVTVHGTRFGVRAPQGPSTIYVVEGEVEVASSLGKLRLQSGKMATVGEASAALDEDDLQWMAPHEHIMLTLEIPKRVVGQGDSPTWRIAFQTASAAPLPLEGIQDLRQKLYLKVIDPNRKEYVAPLDAGIVPVEARPTANGLTRLDVMTPCLLTYRVKPALFPSAGRYAVTLVYQGRQGVLQSDPLSLEVH